MVSMVKSNGGRQLLLLILLLGQQRLTNEMASSCCNHSNTVTVDILTVRVFPNRLFLQLGQLSVCGWSLYLNKLKTWTI